MIVGVALFGIFAGITYWFPKITGFILDERLGKRAFWLWLIGFFVSFIPLYLLGFMGATRRLDHYAASTGWQPLYITSTVGFVHHLLRDYHPDIPDNYKHKRKKTAFRYYRRSLEWKNAGMGDLFAAPFL